MSPPFCSTPLRPLAALVIGALFAGSSAASDLPTFDQSRMTRSQWQAAKVLPQLERLATDRAGVPQHISAKLGFLPTEEKSLRHALPALLKQLQPLLNYAGELRLVKVTNEPDGLRHLLIEQAISGVDVRSAGLTLHVRASDGAVVSLDANLLARDGLPTMAKRSATQAFDALTHNESLSKGTKLSGTPRLVYWRSSEAQAHLAWEMNVLVPEGAGLEEFELLVDSESGRELARSALGPLLLDREVWRENSPAEEEATGDWETLMRSENVVYPGGDSPEYTNVYDFAGATYNYFLHSFGRDSWDGLGSKMKGEIKDGRGFNAGWDRTRKRAWFYRPGTNPSVLGATYNSLDAVAHEFGHGVTRSTINLQLGGLSGALDETLSDVHGAMTEASVRGLSNETWLLYNESYKPGSASLAYRYMNNPELDREINSSMYSRDHWSNRYTGTAGNGGVHYNSGIGNLAYYLLAMGGSHPRLGGNWVSGVGTKRAQEIYYWAVHGGYLAGNSASTFVEFRTATTEVAAARYGGVDLLSVCQAWDAVGVPTSSSIRRCPSSTLPAPPGLVRATSSCNPVRVSWSFVSPLPWPSSGVINYELYRSNTRDDFSLKTLVYRGTATSFATSLPSSDGTENTKRHFRVRACASTGCGPLSQSVASVDALPTYMCTLQ